MYLETRGFTVKAETLALNVKQWRDKRGLSESSTQESLEETFFEVKKDYPGVQSVNDALQMRRWSRANERKENYSS